IDAASGTTVVGANVYKGNSTNRNIGAVIETRGIDLLASDPLFVNAPNRNFYLTQGSKAIDSSVNSLQERSALQTVTAPLGIPPSPILAPESDLFGQFRSDDPSVPSPGGLGLNVFKDRGAIDRVDFLGLTASLLTPPDND